jgi:CRISPR-associated protein Cmr1
MPRPLPDVALPTLERHPSSEWSYTLETITPMFGGSAVSGTVDATNPIRPSSVRGHLRFWWRATASANYPTLEALARAEEVMWGSTEKQGAIQLQVEVLKKGHEIKCAEYRWNQSEGKYKGPYFKPSWPEYALFPFKGELTEDKQHVETEPSHALIGVEFRLILRGPSSVTLELVAALSAWVLFGGIGARTRRGCGSLAIGSSSKNKIEPVQLTTSPHTLLTTMPRFYLEGDPCSDPLIAWSKTVEVYRDFRQGAGFARNYGKTSSKPGQSRWPEPDTLRRLSGRKNLKHPPIHQVSGYPRANLGLPIVFQFQGKELLPQLLQRAVTGKTRFASPVITKIIRRGDSFVPIVVILCSPNVWEGREEGVDLKIGNHPVSKDQVDLPLDQRKQIKPLETYRSISIRGALVIHVKTAGFRKVNL